jgi:hypothetical protein
LPSCRNKPTKEIPRRLIETLGEAGEQVAELLGTEEPSQKPQVHLKGIEEVVGDKGYHSSATLKNLRNAEVRTYISEKKQVGRRHWEGKAEQQQATYVNRRHCGDSDEGNRDSGLMVISIPGSV